MSGLYTVLQLTSEVALSIESSANSFTAYLAAVAKGDPGQSWTPELLLEAGENLEALDAVSVGSDGKAYKSTQSEDDVAAFLGFCKSNTTSGSTSSMAIQSQLVTGFSGLLAREEYWLKGSDIVIYDIIEAGEWTRSVGIGVSSDTLYFTLGPIIQK